MTKAAQSKASADRGTPISWMSDPLTVCRTLMDRQVDALQALEVQVLNVRLSKPSHAKRHANP
jgi:hypothetical protein